MRDAYRRRGREDALSHLRVSSQGECQSCHSYSPTPIPCHTRMTTRTANATAAIGTWGGEDRKKPLLNGPVQLPTLLR